MVSVWGGRILILAAVVPISLLWLIISEDYIVSKLGKTVTAHLEAVGPNTHKGRPRPDGRHFNVVYNFDAGGGRREAGYAMMDTGGAAPPAVGSPIAVKVLYIWPHYRSRLRDQEIIIGPACCFSVFPTVLTIGWGVGIVVVLYPSLRERRIMKRGLAVEGSVAQKVKRDGEEYLVWYRFPARDGKTWGNKAKVSEQEFAKYQEGQPVLVVYLAHRPIASVLYEASKYRAS
jgi:hypothetical protein